MTNAPDTAAAAALLYSSGARPDTPPTATDAARTSADALYPTAAKTADTSPGRARGPAAQPDRGTWQAPGAAQPAAPQPETKAAAEPPAGPSDETGLYVEPLKTMAEAVAATPLPEGDADAHGLDMGEEGKAARESVRSVFLASGASAAETSGLWGMAVEAARPDYQPQTYEAAERDLRAAWGADYDARLNRARTLMRDVARKHPAVAAEVKKLGLDNSPRFIMAVEKAARRRGR